MQNNKASRLYPMIKALVRLLYPKMEVMGAENLPQEPVIVVGNHCQMNGPICCELYFPGERYTWCAGEMMHRKEVPAYAYRDFWSEKPRYLRPFYKLLSHIIAPLSECVFNSAKTIGVYHDGRILSTFKQTVRRLEEGSSIVIFPEHSEPYNHILCGFQDKFIDVARLYYKKTGKQLAFVPLYIAPRLKKMYLGEPVWFCADRPIEEERQRICRCMAERITQIACALPRHRVVPYRNVSRKEYPFNLPEERVYEKTGG